MRYPRSIGAVALASASVLTLGAFRFTGFDDPTARTAAAKSTTWLVGQQLPDGGFETAGFAGFETPDAILAIAENAQTTRAWNRTTARNAVLATTRNGHSPLDVVDDFADGSINAGQAAKLILDVAKPLGLPVNRFDPQHDGFVKLVDILREGLQADGSFGAFNATLTSAIAYRATGRPVPATTIAFIKAAQEAGGGWNYAGDSTGDFADPDTTGLAIQALVAAKLTPADPAIAGGLRWLADNLHTNGSWGSFGDDPNSTSLAVFAVSAAGYDPTSVCWRNKVRPALTGQPYSSPIGWLESQQQPNGRIVSPNDDFGINTFPTSQTVQALRREWTPRYTAAKQSCR